MHLQALTVLGTGHAKVNAVDVWLLGEYRGQNVGVTGMT